MQKRHQFMELDEGDSALRNRRFCKNNRPQSASFHNMSDASSELCAECGGRATTNRMQYTFTKTCATLPFESHVDLIDQLLCHLILSPRVPRDPAEFFAASSAASWVVGEPIAESIRCHPTIAGMALGDLCSALVYQAIPSPRPWDRDRIPPHSDDVYLSYPILSKWTGLLSRALIYKALGTAYTITDRETQRGWLAEVRRLWAFDRDGTLSPGLTQELADCTTEVAYKFASNGAYAAEWSTAGMPWLSLAEGISTPLGYPRWPQTFAWANL